MYKIIYILSKIVVYWIYRIVYIFLKFVYVKYTKLYSLFENFCMLNMQNCVQYFFLKSVKYTEL